MFSIQRYGLMTSLEENVLGDRGHGDEAGGMRHSCSVHVRTKDSNSIVTRHPESLNSFERLLPIIQAWSHAMYLEVGALDECGLGPLSCLETVVRFDMAINLQKRQRTYGWIDISILFTFSHSEADVVPICKVNSQTCRYPKMRLRKVPIVSRGGGGNGITILASEVLNQIMQARNNESRAVGKVN